MSKTNDIATSWQRLQDRLRERDGQAMENHGTCPRCGATIVGKVTGPETALEDEIERLRERCEAYKGQIQAGSNMIERLNAMLAWIDNIDPQLVDAARERLGVVENGN